MKIGSITHAVSDAVTHPVSTVEHAAHAVASGVTDLAHKDPKRLASIGAGVVGGALVLTGVGAPLGGALLVAGSGLALSEDAPQLLHHPKSIGAWASVGGDLLGAYGGLGAVTAPLSAGAAAASAAGGEASAVDSAAAEVSDVLANPVVHGAAEADAAAVTGRQAISAYSKIKHGTFHLGDAASLAATGVFVGAGATHLLNGASGGVPTDDAPGGGSAIADPAETAGATSESTPESTTAATSEPTADPAPPAVGEPAEIDGTPGGARPAGMMEFRKAPIPVTAEPQDHPFDVKVDWQDEPLHGKPGDYLVQDVGNPASARVVDHDIFNNTYQPNADGTFVKSASVQAVQMDHPFDVRSLEGITHGAAGDYLVQGPAGEAWIIKQDVFTKTYQPTGADVSR